MRMNRTDRKHEGLQLVASEAAAKFFASEDYVNAKSVLRGIKGISSLDSINVNLLKSVDDNYYAFLVSSYNKFFNDHFYYDKKSKLYTIRNRFSLCLLLALLEEEGNVVFDNKFIAYVLKKTKRFNVISHFVYIIEQNNRYALATNTTHDPGFRREYEFYLSKTADFTYNTAFTSKENVVELALELEKLHSVIIVDLAETGHDFISSKLVKKYISV